MRTMCAYMAYYWQAGVRGAAQVESWAQIMVVRPFADRKQLATGIIQLI